MNKTFIMVILSGSLACVQAQDRVTTLAGKLGTSAFTNGTGLSAAFADPASIVADGSGNFFVADSANNVIRKIAPGGMVTTFAGQPGVTGFADGTTSAQFNAPSGLAMDLQSNLFVSDTGNNTIRKITPQGVVSTLAGVAQTSGYLDGAAGSALFTSPLGLAVSAGGQLYVSDSGNHCIRIVSNGTVSTFAGNPQHWGAVDGGSTNALFDSPCGITFDSAGNLFVSDANNNAIRKITSSGQVSTFAGALGKDGYLDGSAALARFWSPAELTFDKSGNLMVADSRNQVIRQITPGGQVSTVSGAAHIYGGQDGANGTARFYNPYSIALATDGLLLVTDTYNELIRNVIIPFQISLQTQGPSHSVRLTWQSVIGKTYQVQFNTGYGTVWNTLSPSLTALSNSLAYTDTNAAGQSARLYRVLLTP